MRRIAALAIVAGIMAMGPGGLDGRAFGQAAGGAPQPPAFSDEAVAKAIEKGVAFLQKARKADGSYEPFGKPGEGNYHPDGPACLAAYAMLESELVTPLDPEMQKTLEHLLKAQAPDKLASAKLKPGENNQKSWEEYCHGTYTLGLRANVWLSAIRHKAAKYAPNLRADAMQLVKSTKDGSYGYTSYGQMDSAGDNSNSQYGVLGVWAAAQNDEEVPKGYWFAILKHWLECMQSDGGWCYSGSGESTASMTCAGLATLFVCYDNLLSDGFSKCDQGVKTQTVLKPLTRALDWMDKNFVGIMSGQKMGYGDLFYLLYGVERVGLASGYKYFGQADWYKIGATKLLAQQDQTTGAWTGSWGQVVATSYAILFLVRGRHAVLFNKLEYDGDWNNRPRDLASLTRWTSKQFENTVNWQIINLRVPPDEWHDAPILYIAGSKAPKFTAQDIDALRTYVNQGGTIMSCTECDGKEFSKGIRALYAQMFPNYPMTAVPKTHKLYTINLAITVSPDYQMVSNGVRPLVIHTDKDLPKAWQLRLTQTEKDAFQATSNVANYITSLGLADTEKKTLAARGSADWPAEVKFQTKRTVTVARLQYKTPEGKAGNFDPEPLAWQRFTRMLGPANGTKVDVKGPMPIAELAASGAKVAVLSGTDAVALSGEEAKALQDFIKAGGLLLLEAVGGGRGFAGESIELIIRQVVEPLPADLVPNKRLRRLPSGSPLYQIKGAEIKEVTYKKYSRNEMGVKGNAPLLTAITDAKGEPLVLVSTEDITGGLVGYLCYEVNGYKPASAFEIMRNIVMSRAKELVSTQPATKPGPGATPTPAPKPAPAPAPTPAPAPAPAPASQPAAK